MPAVSLQLGLAGASCTYTASETGHLYALAGEAGQHISQLSQLDLQLALLTARPEGEDIEDEHGAVDYANVGHALYVAYLHRRELEVEDDQVDILGGAVIAYLIQLARAHAGCGVEPRQLLRYRGDGLGSG